jgi:ubiquinone/menaquinone biosynthesis C-methylase UbiE
VSDDHARRVEQAFSLQASAFEDPRFNRVFTSDAEWIFAELPLSAQDLVLDVAAGTGHAARLLAPAVRGVVALDATAAMLAVGKAQADAAGLHNIVFARGDAAALPFLDASFDVVVSRFAVHHFGDPDGPLSEMVRCLRPGGRIAVADLVSHDDPEVGQRQNDLERLRDASHTQMLTSAQLRARLAALGVGSITVAERATERPLGPWLEQTATAADARAHIVAALEAELAGGATTGFSPRVLGGELQFSQHFASVIGVRSG